ncbi:putative Cathepsin B [Blattamonas nauphoetae]|uniref:Cathepsin B n=1 Tax=Blattamonas nauphoetae TaxID=2049346 RepID=A0ABQ9X2G4_9EUKA|nr:putative Cathepsin B [Blattamonas nauphoetae]
MSPSKLKQRTQNIKLPPPTSFKEPMAPIDNDLPIEFDSRLVWPDTLVGVGDQGDCGSCWAFAVTTVIANRFAIRGYKLGPLSPQDLVSCDTDDYGCAGSELYPAWNWVYGHGAATEECIPYVSGSGRVPMCPSTCADGTKIKRYQPGSIDRVEGEQKMMKELQERGPIHANMYTYQDLGYYKSGIYSHKTGSWTGGHAVVVIGWGVENDVPYWIIQNSWGKLWGENGYFRMRRGTDECNIESLPVFACSIRVPRP